jgi:hypothetical protein
MNFARVYTDEANDAALPSHRRRFQPELGGWLANEAFEYLLGTPEIDDYLRNVLWGAKLRGEGLEGALSIVQGAYASSKSAETKRQLDRLTQAVIGMFNAMQTAFNKLGPVFS